MSTDYHAKYFAHILKREGGTGLDRIERALFDACVDLNPHQIEASLFALRSPLSKGVLLADEVGLGKTIEAGLVLCQYWAERKRKILVVSPASLRKQWELELLEKFNLPSMVIDAKVYKQLTNQGKSNPFISNNVIIVSMHYANRMAEELKQIAWDLVVIDEAHKLRNVYRNSNRMGRNIRWATEDRKKLLLTATPLQNSLLELFGLSTFIDERLFGDLPSFRTQYINYGGNNADLKDRLKYFSKRTLRKDVLEYINYTERLPITRPFKPTEQEHKLYESISKFLKQEDNYALPKGQRHLLVLLVRKVLASSPRAVAGTLEIIRERLLRLRDQWDEESDLMNQLMHDQELDDDLLDELLEDEEDLLLEEQEELELEDEDEEQIDIEKLNAEIKEIEDYIRWARSIGVDTKTKSLLKALTIGFEKLAEMNAAEKVVVFTESKRTQEYLKEFLESNGYAGKVVTFNGSNTDEDSKSTYTDWIEKNRDSGRSTGSRPVDIRTAIIDKFKDSASIMIATEAAAEGINLQFCSMVINFDLPWNPQRVEQRIGRCHRYGQKHDVVVINFLNEKNEADRRVYELLDKKFKLFTGVFGASDDVLGSIESGADFERKVLDIYQKCRTVEEIESAFNQLQDQLDEQIQLKMRDTRRLILEHFDEDVHERLKVNLDGARERLDRIGRMFWTTTQHTLHDSAEFDSRDFSFILNQPPTSEVKPGKYKLISKSDENVVGDFLYRLSHPLGEWVITEASGFECAPATLTFDYTNHPNRISVIEKLVGKSGWLSLQSLKIDSFQRDEYLLFSSVDEEGNSLDQETCEKLFNCPGDVTGNLPAFKDGYEERLKAEAQRHAQATISRNLEENNAHFNEARDQLDKWADDMVKSAEKELDDTKRQIRELQRQSRQAQTLTDQHSLQEDVAKLEKKKRKLREKIFQVEDDIAIKRDKLVEALEKRMLQKTHVKELFKIQWNVI